MIDFIELFVFMFYSSMSPTHNAKRNSMSMNIRCAPRIALCMTAALCMLFAMLLAQGNVIAASDGVGAIQYNESYLPYGERRVNSPASAVAQANGNRLWFHGKAQDEATGLQYFGARYYDPALGRFMGVDPQGFQEANLHSLNRYAYGNNNPLKFQDPDGHLPFLIIPAISWAVSVTSAAMTGYQVGTVANNIATGQQTAADAVREAAPGIAISLAFGAAGKVAAGAVKAGKVADKAAEGAKETTKGVDALVDAAAGKARRSGDIVVQGGRDRAKELFREFDVNGVGNRKFVRDKTGGGRGVEGALEDGTPLRIRMKPDGTTRIQAGEQKFIFPPH